MTQSESLQVALAQAMDGEALVKALSRICSERGWPLHYLPVSVAVAGLGSSERKVYRDVAVIAPRSRVQVHAADGDLERGTEVREVLLSPASEEAAALGKDLKAYRPSGEESQAVRPVDSGYHVPEARDYSKGFRVLVAMQGPWGERIEAHLRKGRPPHWRIGTLRLPAELPPLIDDPSSYIPEPIPQSDLVLLLSEHPSSAQLLPDLVRASGARAAIAPIDSPAWLPVGEAMRLSKMLKDWGAESAFPRPFCSLREVGAPAVDEFARHFGAPSVGILSEDGRHVGAFLVHRGAACGCTESVAEGMVGTRLEEAVERAGLLHHHFPCLASMAREEDLGDTLMHVSGFELKREVEGEVKKHRKGDVGYLEPAKGR